MHVTVIIHVLAYCVLYILLNFMIKYFLACWYTKQQSCFYSERRIANEN
jgi:hypothetical protein